MRLKSPHKILHDLANDIIKDNCLHGKPSDNPLAPSRLNSYGRKYPKVGSLIESLPVEERNALKSLTSDQANDVRTHS